jgi:hypothetical protein
MPLRTEHRPPPPSLNETGRIVRPAPNRTARNTRRTRGMNLFRSRATIRPSLSISTLNTAARRFSVARAKSPRRSRIGDVGHGFAGAFENVQTNRCRPSRQRE